MTVKKPVTKPSAPKLHESKSSTKASTVAKPSIASKVVKPIEHGKDVVKTKVSQAAAVVKPKVMERQQESQVKKSEEKPEIQKDVTRFEPKDVTPSLSTVKDDDNASTSVTGTESLEKQPSDPEEHSHGIDNSDVPSGEVESVLAKDISVEAVAENEEVGEQEKAADSVKDKEMAVPSHKEAIPSSTTTLADVAQLSDTAEDETVFDTTEQIEPKSNDLPSDATPLPVAAKSPEKDVPSTVNEPIMMKNSVPDDKITTINAAEHTHNQDEAQEQSSTEDPEDAKAKAEIAALNAALLSSRITESETPTTA